MSCTALFFFFVSSPYFFYRCYLIKNVIHKRVPEIHLVVNLVKNFPNVPRCNSQVLFKFFVLKVLICPEIFDLRFIQVNVFFENSIVQRMVA